MPCMRGAACTDILLQAFHFKTQSNNPWLEAAQPTQGSKG